MVKFLISEYGPLEIITSLDILGDLDLQTDVSPIVSPLDTIEPGFFEIEMRDLPTPKKRSRKKPTYLGNFKSKNGNSPKKEYVRCKLIRGHKRAIRNSFIGKKAKKTINRINPKNKKQLLKFDLFANHAIKNKIILEIISRPENGPKTDGISKKSKSEYEQAEKSFNDNYCRKYFSNSITRDSFELYCEVLFYGSSVNELCEKFDFACCTIKNNHSDECRIKWNKLESFLKNELMNELGIGSQWTFLDSATDDSGGCDFNNMNFSD
jgi:hypothetical protein